MEKGLEKILGGFKEKRILILGDVFLDKFSLGNIERINPEQPAAPLVKIIKEDYYLGGAGNVANNIISLGGKCGLYGVIGNDFLGNAIEELCKKKSIYFQGFVEEKPTVVKQRIIAHKQQVTRLDFGEKNIEKISKRNEELVVNSLKNKIKDYNFAMLVDYDKGFFSKTLAQKIIKISNKEKVQILVDPKPQNITYFKNCTIISPNKGEAEKITGIKYSNDNGKLIEMAKKLCNLVNTRYAIITCGEDGVVAYERDKRKSLFMKTEAKEVANPTGAGDTFSATFALSLASGLNIEKAVRLANYAAGFVVSKIGTYAITPDDLEKQIKISNSKNF